MPGRLDPVLPVWPPAAGMKWMQYIIAVATLMGIITALTVGLFSASRIVMSAARDWWVQATAFACMHLQCRSLDCSPESSAAGCSLLGLPSAILTQSSPRTLPPHASNVTHTLPPGPSCRLLPPFLAKISPRTQTPLVAQMVLGVIIGEVARHSTSPACTHPALVLRFRRLHACVAGRPWWVGASRHGMGTQLLRRSPLLSQEHPVLLAPFVQRFWP